jgi:1-aminocyclopropane-1-carboxylate deaminase/D-cysteine desulfhydrase-like pyridoxal-dependent ACC family enzyme
MRWINENSIRVQSLHAPWLQEHNIQLDVLRLDEVHPVVSGNKWFKLYYYLTEALAGGYKAIATFGGAYSNHIVAAAYACKAAGVQSIGIMRGEAPANYSHTLVQAKELGMQLHFVSREAYRQKEGLKALYLAAYWIDEGGYGKQGAAGAARIPELTPQWEQYTHIITAVGTGTTLAGLAAAALPHQTLIGISALKGHAALEGEVRKLLLPSLAGKSFSINHDYHFGGYAKYNAALLQYMNRMWEAHRLPLDFVYTAKAMYGTEALIRQGTILPSSRVLMVHTGGLQGNLSLPAGTLTF